MRREKKTVVLTARVDDAIGRAIQELAESDDRTISNYIERVLREHVAQKGKLTDKPKRGQK